jgi:phosphatidylethanolamine-binding protein (PEBP) family uncharacterized protein
MQNITIWSEAFKNGESIPVEYTCDGKNISPGLSWSGIPAGTNSISLYSLFTFKICQMLTEAN